MDIKKIKKYIYDNDKVEYILNAIGCKDIVRHSNYYSCSNYNGDNKNAVIQYFDTEYLNCVNYTRQISFNKSENTSIIDLVCYNKGLNYFHGLKYLCDLLDLDYYALENDEDVPESLKVLEMLYEMSSGDYEEEDCRLAPISEKILTYYKPYPNRMFTEDNISTEVQKLFEIGYDDSTNHITIPIRDEIGNLVGVKGRVFDFEAVENKYIALERYAKSKVLYGLYRAEKHIRDKGFVYIVESEKAVMQLWTMGYYNVVATGGKKISRSQKNKLSSFGVDLIFCYDKDVGKEEIENIAKDFNGVNIYMLHDKEDILEEKESPSDNAEKWSKLIGNKENLIKIKSAGE